ncbi:MAG TPA: biotin/lipoyl-binding carrier protein [Spirillospora sp.]
MTEVAAELTANVWQVRASVGDELDEGDEIVVLEAMKMEVPVVAPRAGRLVELRVAPDDVVNEGDVIAVLA